MIIPETCSAFYVCYLIAPIGVTWDRGALLTVWCFKAPGQLDYNSWTWSLVISIFRKLPGGFNVVGVETHCQRALSAMRALGLSLRISDLKSQIEGAALEQDQLLP